MGNLPQKYAIQILEYYAKNNLNTQINIRDISGNIFSNFSLVDVDYMNKFKQRKLIEIKKATLHYNPFKAIINYKNPIKSIDFLGLSNINLFLTRDKMDN